MILMKILPFPELRQAYDWDCGASAIQSILIYYGIDVRAGLIIKEAGTNHDHGTTPENMKAVFKSYKLKCTSGKITIDEIKDYINKKTPVILLLQAWTRQENVDWKNDWDDGHYVVAIGYDSKRIYFEDPYSLSRTYLSYDDLLLRWHHRDSNGKKYLNWGLVVTGQRSSAWRKARPMG